ESANIPAAPAPGETSSAALPRTEPESSVALADVGERPPSAATREPPEVFISYRITPDERVATALLRLLESSNDPPPSFFVASAGGLTPSNIGYRGQLAHAARSAKVFIGVLSKESREREWIFFEAGAAWGRNALYAPVLLDVSPEGLPDSIGEYQATRAKDSDDMRLLVSEVARRTGRNVRPHFPQRYSAFERIVQAYPNEPDETEEPPLVRMLTLLISKRYEYADALAKKLIASAATDRDRGEIAVDACVWDARKNSYEKLETLSELPSAWRAESPHYHYGSSGFSVGRGRGPRSGSR